MHRKLAVLTLVAAAIACLPAAANARQILTIPRARQASLANERAYWHHVQAEPAEREESARGLTMPVKIKPGPCRRVKRAVACKLKLTGIFTTEVFSGGGLPTEEKPGPVETVTVENLVSLEAGRIVVLTETGKRI